MTPERYLQIDELVAAALELDSTQREAFLTNMCGMDHGLRREADAWLAADQEADKIGFLSESPTAADYTELLVSNQSPGQVLASYEVLPRTLSLASITNHDYLGMLLNERYLVKSELGRGNIGVVYRALDQQLHSRPVAIKVLLEESLQNSWFKKKLAQEIEALARIDHPGIVEVLDRGETSDGNPFLVMKLIGGQTLRSLINGERSEFKRVAQIVRQIGQALSAAHDQRVVHCDLKPENLMIQTLPGDEQQIKIVDFGVAKVRNSQVAQESEGTLVAGTPAYMAPEQLDGFPTAASDIFSFGVIAYELLTGEHPFKGALEWRRAIRLGPKKKPKDLRPDLPIAAQEIIVKALSFEQNDRYQQARDFGELLAQALTTDLELPSPAEASESLDMVMVHILYMELVGYSKLPPDDQSQIYEELQGIVSGTDAFASAKAVGQVISRSTGDSIALVFFNSLTAPVQCALEISRVAGMHPGIELRMGVNSGPVYRVKDLHEVEDVADAGINMAQRVMDCGDAGHILMSKSVADVLKELAGWRDYVHDLGEHSDKHGARVHLFNVCGGEAGNPNFPEQFRKKRTGLLVFAAIAALILITITVSALAPNFLSKTAGLIGAFPKQPLLAPSDFERNLNYSVRVQKYRNGIPFEDPFQLAGTGYVFEKDYRLKLNFTSQQPGYFYVLNEPPAQGNTIPGLIVLHASTRNDAASPFLDLEFPEGIWLKFDDKKGTEKLWVVWSARQVETLEAVKGLDNPQDNGRITDPERAKAVYEFLKGHSDSTTLVAEDKEQKVTHIRVKGEVLVYPLELQHR